MRSRIELQRLASQLRLKLGTDSESPIDITSLLAPNSKLTVIFYPFTDQISGMCVKSANLIAINSRSTLGRQNFSLAHELYHYCFDDSGGDSATINEVSVFYQNYNTEREADLFASHLLIPDITLNKKVNHVTNNQENSLILRDIIELEQFFKVSRQAMLSRLVVDEYLTKREADKFRNNVISNARLLGFDDSLYKPSSLRNNKQTLGAYITRTVDLSKKGVISQGKYEEYLLDAFREDLVFGDIEEELYD
ncbi:MAG: ImmA/IrrE family metallo-endopeptidase [Erysipelothrix sp.]|nr:ImmA/IrrE family metallo-endopeptidase [Erysipelothrix sp.]